MAETKSALLNMRVENDLYAALKEAGDQAGRSLANEVRHRLRASLTPAEATTVDETTRDTLDAIRLILAMARHWHEDPAEFWSVALAIERVIKLYMPKGTAETPTERDQGAADAMVGLLPLLMGQGRLPPSGGRDATQKG